MRVNHIAIIGFGPRGLNILDRLIENIVRDEINNTIKLHIIDPGKPAEGSHLSNQPDHLLVNTVSSQITLHAGDSVSLKNGGKSFIQWARHSGYKSFNNKFIKSDDGLNLTEMEYLPRSLLGAYLNDSYKNLLTLLPKNICVVEHRKTAVNIVKDNRLKVYFDDGETIDCDFVFLSTGHGYRKPTISDIEFSNFYDVHLSRNPLLSYFRSPYPISRLDFISSRANVLIQGFGLTAHDAISALTIGRGGKYSKSGNKLTYIASGNEPKIFLSSRQCLPFAGRGVNQKGLTGRHVAQFITTNAVESIRQNNTLERNTSKIDFELQILPLILKEMAYAWQCAEARKQLNPNSFVADPNTVKQIEKVLWPLRDEKFANYSSWRDFFLNLVENDLEQALLGNVDSPLKAATDVLRDVREAIRRAVEWSGLTRDSHKYFIEVFNPIINRVSFGPPLRRNQELLALFESGVVELGGGPGSKVTCDKESSRYLLCCGFKDENYKKYMDVVITARLDGYSPLNDSSDLSNNLIQSGVITPYYNDGYHPGGLAIDKKFHPINASGNANQNMWAIGFPIEGAHYYTHALPRPHMQSRQFEEADLCVKDCLSQLITQDKNVLGVVEDLL